MTIKKKGIIIVTAALVIYTAAVILGFAFLQPKASEGKSKNDAWVQSYRHINYTEEEKAEIYSAIGLDMTKLASRGFTTYNEVFMTPADWAKELHVIELGFENIYCSVRIFVHTDEIGWERGRTYIAYTPIEIIGLPFEQSTHGTLRIDDTAKGVLYSLDCSESPDSEIYQEFLRLFFNKEQV